MGSLKASQTVEYLGKCQNVEHGISVQTKAHQNNCLDTEKHTLHFENVFGCVSISSSKTSTSSQDLRCSTPLTLWEMQLKTTSKQYHIHWNNYN